VISDSELEITDYTEVYVVHTDNVIADLAKI
jgi:hypothetical protein